MSFELRNLVLSRRLGGFKHPACNASAMARKAVLAAMADRANDDGSDVFVSKTRVAAETELGRDAVVNATKSLLLEGLIEETGRRPGRQGFTYVYRIVVSKVEALARAWVKCRNSDTLDDALDDGDEPVGAALTPPVKPAPQPVEKPVSDPVEKKSKVSELPPQRGVNSGHELSFLEQSSSARERARPVDGRLAASDPEYAREVRSSGGDGERPRKTQEAARRAPDAPPAGRAQRQRLALDKRIRGYRDELRTLETTDHAALVRRCPELAGTDWEPRKAWLRDVIAKGEAEMRALDAAAKGVMA